MKKLCLSSYLKILYFSKVGINSTELYKCLVGSLFEDEFAYDNDPGTITRYKNGSKDIPRPLSTAATNGDVNDLSVEYSDNLVKKLSPDKKFNIVLAIKDLLEDDVSLPKTTVIGDHDAFTKEIIVNNSTFCLPDFLANITMYCLKVPNVETKEVDKPFFDSFDSRRNEINFNDNPLKVDTELTNTARQDLFDKTFFEITHPGSLTTPNHSTIKIYALSFQNKEFSFRDINSFVLSNIGRYVFSRAKRNEYKINDNLEALAFDAIKELKRINPSFSLGDHFSEIMLYSFLECALNAPKILSKVELNKLGGSFNSSSSGVHLLVSNDVSLRNHQLAFGASNVLNNLNIAIDNAFLQVTEIINNLTDEIDLVESSILDSTFDKETTDFLKHTLVPSKSTMSAPDTSFGVFLGYSISLDGTDSLNNIDFANHMKNRMQADILSVIPYIQSKISTLGLSGYSFYFYVLPLIDAEDDKDTIMNSSLGVE